jgi:hypothetical protein
MAKRCRCVCNPSALSDACFFCAVSCVCSARRAPRPASPRHSCALHLLRRYRRRAWRWRLRHAAGEQAGASRGTPAVSGSGRRHLFLRHDRGCLHAYVERAEAGRHVSARASREARVCGHQRRALRGAAGAASVWTDVAAPATPGGCAEQHGNRQRGVRPTAVARPA